MTKLYGSRKGSGVAHTYETQFAATFGTNFCAFSFWKARIALYAILKALDFQENDEIILPGYTCVVVPNAIRYTRCCPVYADIARRPYNLDPCSVEQRLSVRTRALIVQHTYGIPADIHSLQAIADKYGLCLIEDCAHVLLGSSYQGKLLGSFGMAAFFSFQWSKPYTTGLGGMVVTKDKKLAEQLKKVQSMFCEPPLRQRIQLKVQYQFYRRFFGPKVYWWSQKSLHMFSKLGLFVGSSSPEELNGTIPYDICWNMSEFQRRAGFPQISEVGDNAAHRRSLTKYYSDSLRSHGWPVDDGLSADEIILLRYPLRVASKTEVLEKARRFRIEIGSWFETPLHPLPMNNHYAAAYQLGCCPVAESTAATVINLPLHNRVNQAEAERIVHFLLSHASPA
jgi:perosamine synthetase